MEEEESAPGARNPAVATKSPPQRRRGAWRWIGGTLLILVLVTSPWPSLPGSAAAGVSAGLLCLTRPSLLPLLQLQNQVLPLLKHQFPLVVWLLSLRAASALKSSLWTT